MGDCCVGLQALLVSVSASPLDEKGKKKKTQLLVLYVRIEVEAWSNHWKIVR